MHRNKKYFAAVLGLMAAIMIFPPAARAATISITKSPGGAPVTSGTAYLFSAAGSYLSVSSALGAPGQVSFNLTAGQSYKLRIDRYGAQFWSPVFDGSSPLVEVVFPHSDRTITVETVYGASVAPLSGAPVYVYGGSGGLTYETLTQNTNAAGQATFNLPDGYNYRYRGDYRTIQTYSSLSANLTDAVDIPVAQLRVRFFADLAQPSGVPVYVFNGSGSYLTITAQTNSNGEVLFTSLPSAGTYKFRADYQGSQYWSAPVANPAAGSETAVDLSVPTENVSFVMRSASAGPALTSGTVYLFTGAGVYLNRSQVVGPGGVVSFAALTGGSYKFRYDNLGVQVFSPVITVPGSATFTEFVVPHSVRTITAETAFGADHVPLSGATVYAFTSTGSYLNLSAVSAADGTVPFFLPDALSAKFRVDYLNKQTWSGSSTNLVTNVAIPVSNVRVEFPIDFTPIGPVEFYAYLDNGTYLNLSGSAVDGSHLFVRLPSDQLYKFRADYLAFQYWAAPGATLAPGVETTVTFDLDAETAAFYMRSSSGGEPLQSGMVYLFSGGGMFLNQARPVGGDGLVTFNGLTPGSYQFRYDALGTQTFSPAVSVPGIASFGEFVVPFSQRTVHVETVNGSVHTPLADTPVYVFAQNGSYLNTSLTTDSNGDARFFLPGSLQAKFRADYRNVQTLIGPSVSPAETISISVSNVRTRFLAGSGAVPGVPVYAFLTSGTYLNLTGTTDASGEYLFPDLPVAGSYKFRANYLGSQYWSADVTSLTGGAEYLVEFGLISENPSFTMRSSSGGPVLGSGSVYLFTSSGTYLGQTVTVGPDGQVNFSGLTPGTYKFRYDVLGTQTFSQAVTVPGSNTFTEFVVPFSYRTASVVTDYSGVQVPLSSVSIYAFKPDGSYLGLSAQSDSNGHVQFWLPDSLTAKYRADYLGYQFWSPETAGNATAVVPIASFTVKFRDGTSYPAATAYVFTEAGAYFGYFSAVSGPGGTSFVLPAGVAYKFRINYGGQQYFSSPETAANGETHVVEVAINATGNIPPVADAGYDLSDQLVQSLVQLDGSASYDPDNGPASYLAYSWLVVTRPLGSSAVLSDADTAYPSIIPDATGVWVFGLVVNDGSDDSLSAQVTVTVEPNQAPVAIVNAPARVIVDRNVTMSAGDSYDPDNRPESLSVSWSFIERPQASSATLQSLNSFRNSFTADVAGAYRFQVTVSDGRDMSAPVEVQVVAVAAGVTITTPSEGQRVLVANVTISGTAVSDVEVSSLFLAVDGGQPVSLMTDPGSELPFSTAQTLTDGSHTAEVVSVDSYGVTRSAVRQFYVDTVPPELTITSPTEGETYAPGPIPVEGTATDASGIAYVNVDGSPVTVAPDGRFSTAVAYSANGSYSVTVEAADLAGRVTAVVRHFTVNAASLAPVVVISEPANDSTVGSPLIYVRGQVILQAPLQSLFLNGYPLALSPDGYFDTEYTLSTGVNLVLIEATDEENRQGEASVSVIYDAAPPVITLTAPEDLLVVSQNSVNVTGTVTDDGLLEQVTVNGQAAGLGSGGSFSVSVGLVEGPNTITVSAVDSFARTATETRTVYLDTVPPVVHIDHPPQNFRTNSPSVSVSGTVSDANPIDEISFAGGAAVLDFSDSSFSGSYDLVPGLNSIAVTATDISGKVGSTSVTVVYDNVAPVITLTELPEAVGVPEVTLQGRVTSEDGLGSVTLVYTGPSGSAGTPETVTPDGDGYFTLTAGITEGPNTFAVTATDTVGNSATKSLTVKKDTTPPTIISTNPANGATDVPFTQAVSVVFSEPIRFETLQAGVRISGPEGPFAFSLSLNDDRTVATLIVPATYPLDTAIQLDIGADSEHPITDIVGLPLGGQGIRFRTTAKSYRVFGQVFTQHFVPIVKAVVELRGAQLSTTTDSDGYFEFKNPPAGSYVVYVDARSVTVEGKQYEIFGKRIEVVAGQDTDIPFIVMPAMKPETASFAQAGGPSPVDFNGALGNDRQGRLLLETEAGSLTFPDGKRDGVIMAAEMPVQAVPDAVKEASGRIVAAYSLQPSGTIIDPPAQITLPNTQGYEVGKRFQLLLYSHETGEPEVAGEMEVVATEWDASGNPTKTEIRSVTAKVGHFSDGFLAEIGWSGSDSKIFKDGEGGGPLEAQIQEVSNLIVKVVDQFGKPLKNITVFMGGSNNYYEVTDENGKTQPMSFTYSVGAESGRYILNDATLMIGQRYGSRTTVFLTQDVTLAHGTRYFTLEIKRVVLDGEAVLENPPECAGNACQNYPPKEGLQQIGESIFPAGAQVPSGPVTAYLPPITGDSTSSARLKSGWLQTVSNEDLFCNTTVYIFTAPPKGDFPTVPAYVLENRSTDHCVPPDSAVKPGWVFASGTRGTGGDNTISPTQRKPNLWIDNGRIVFQYQAMDSPLGSQSQRDFVQRFAIDNRVKAVVHHASSGYIGWSMSEVSDRPDTEGEGATGGMITTARLRESVDREVRMYPPLVKITGKRTAASGIKYLFSRGGWYRVGQGADQSVELYAGYGPNLGHRMNCGMLTSEAKSEPSTANAGWLPANLLAETNAQGQTVRERSNLCSEAAGSLAEKLRLTEETPVVGAKAGEKCEFGITLDYGNGSTQCVSAQDIPLKNILATGAAKETTIRAGNTRIGYSSNLPVAAPAVPAGGASVQNVYIYGDDPDPNTLQPDPLADPFRIWGRTDPECNATCRDRWFDRDKMVVSAKQSGAPDEFTYEHYLANMECMDEVGFKDPTIPVKLLRNIVINGDDYNLMLAAMYGEAKVYNGGDGNDWDLRWLASAVLNRIGRDGFRDSMIGLREHLSAAGPQIEAVAGPYGKTLRMRTAYYVCDLENKGYDDISNGAEDIATTKDILTRDAVVIQDVFDNSVYTNANYWKGKVPVWSRNFDVRIHYNVSSPPADRDIVCSYKYFAYDNKTFNCYTHARSRYVVSGGNLYDQWVSGDDALETSWTETERTDRTPATVPIIPTHITANVAQRVAYPANWRLNDLTECHQLGDHDYLLTTTDRTLTAPQPDPRSALNTNWAGPDCR